MSDAFVTETLSETVPILCITSMRELGEQFQQSCPNSEIDVTVVDPESLATLRKQQWYKIFWFDSTFFHTQTHIDRVLNFLRTQSQALSYCLLPYPYLITLPDLNQEVSCFGTSHLVFENIDQRLPYVSTFFYEDVITPSLFLDTSVEAIALPQLTSPLLVQDLLATVWQLAGTPRGGQRKLLVSSWQINTTEGLSKVLLKQTVLTGQRHYELTGLKKISITPSKPRKEIRAQVLQMLEEIVFKNPSTIKAAVALPAPHRSLGREKPSESQSKAAESVVAKVNQVRDETAIVLAPAAFSEPSESVNLEKNTQDSVPEVFVRVTKNKALKVPPVYQPLVPRSKIVLKHLEEVFEKWSNLSPTNTQAQTFLGKDNGVVVATTSQQSFTPPPLRPNLTPVPPTPQSTISSESIENKINELFGKNQLAKGAALPESASKISFENKLGVTPKLRASRLAAEPLWQVAIRKKKHPVVLLGSFVGAGCLLLVSSFFYSRQQAVSQLYAMEMAVTDPEVAFSPAPFWPKVFSTQVGVISPLLPDSTRIELNQLVELNRRISSLLAIRDQTAQKLQVLMTQIFSGQVVESTEKMSALSSAIEEIYKELSLLENELVTSQVFFQRYSPEKKDLLQKSFQHIHQERKKMVQLQQVLQLADEMLGSPEKKTYAVITQDPTEVRPTGGFIQNILIVTFDRGRLVDSQVFTADEIDQRVGGAIAPPASLKKYLREEYWYMRDANWEADFELAQTQINWFLTKALNQPIDGVIGVNYSWWKAVLAATGEMTAAETTITADNFTEKMLQPLSDPKLIQQHQDYLKKVTTTLFDGFKKLTPEKMAIATNGFTKLLSQGEITIAFTDTTHQELIRTLGWSGKILSPACPAQLNVGSCVVSTIYQVDSNVGVNKANYYIKKKADHQVDLKSDQTLHKHILSYENDSLSNNWPSGGYKSLVTYYVPLDSEVTRVLVGSRVLENSEYSIFVEKNFKKLEFLVEIAPKTTSTVTVEYSEKPISANHSYAMFVQKQPGMGIVPTTITLNFGQELIPLVIAPEATVNQNGAIFNFSGEEHSFAGIKFR